MRQLHGRTNGQNVDEKMIAVVLQENEERANHMAVYLFLAGLIVNGFSYTMNVLGIFRIRSEHILAWHLVMAMACLTPILAYQSHKVPQHILKWLNLCFAVLYAAEAEYTISYNATLLMTVPLMLAVAYFSEKTTVITFVTSVGALGLSDYFGSIGDTILDSNHVQVPEGTVLVVKETLKRTLEDAGFRNAEYTKGMMCFGYVSKVLVLVILFVVAHAITRFGYDMLVKQAKLTAERTMAGAELRFAGELQCKALPSVSAINGRYPFEIAASMTAAKEAGGDFYDFTMIDDNHLALVIADVCGKSVPAAMLMMSAKEKLHGAFAPGRTPGEILYKVNNSLCENNAGKMFVTVWLGILDIQTGIMTSANGGHEDPLMKKGTGEFEEVAENHGIALGVRKNSCYPEQKYQFEKGDILLQYTDGVTEARNAGGELYGIRRLRNGLSVKFSGCEPNADEVNCALREQVSDFVGEAEQSDDLTTLILKYESLPASDRI